MIKQYSLEDKLRIFTIKDLSRIYFSTKDYCYIECAMLSSHCGIYSIMLSDKAILDKRDLLLLQSGSKLFIKEIIRARVMLISNLWTQNCYYYNSFDAYLKEVYNITESNYRRLLKLIKDNNHDNRKQQGLHHSRRKCSYSLQ